MKKDFYVYIFALLYGYVKGKAAYWHDEVSAIQVLLLYSFGYFEIDVTAVVDVTLACFPLILFIVAKGTYIYRNFCEAGVYIFSRCPNRKEWFIRESLKLYLQSLLYSFCLYSMGTLMFCIVKNVNFERGFFIILAAQTLIMSLWLFFFAELSNVLACYIGSYKAIMVSLIIKISLIASLSMWAEGGLLSLGEDNTYRARNLFLLKCNPVSQIILCFHSSHYEHIQENLNVYNMNFSIFTSIVYMTLISLTIFYYGVKIINRIDICGVEKRR